MPTSDASSAIVIRRARQHNLKDLDLDIPRNRLVVITGPSGSGKSSLAFDTIYAEGQRRYVESLSSYARQFLDVMEKPDVDRIDGLSPAVAIQQRGPSRNPRSTVGTLTEIYDYLRLLFARAGVPHCPVCGREIVRHTVDQLVDRVLELPDRPRLQILAPMVRDQPGAHLGILDGLRKEGYVRVRVDGEVHSLDSDILPDKTLPHTIEAVVDRLVVGPDISGRLSDSLETAISVAGGLVTLDLLEEGQTTYSTRYACVEGHFELEDLEPRLFSFNSPHGACPTCNGLGLSRVADPEKVVPDPARSIGDGAIAPWGIPKGEQLLVALEKLGRALRFDLKTPFQDLPPPARKALLHGSTRRAAPFPGVLPEIQRACDEGTTEDARERLEPFTKSTVCESCNGARLRPEALAIRLSGLSIAEIAAATIDRSADLLESLDLSEAAEELFRPLLEEIQNRLRFLEEVGVGYLSLGRPAATLSGGEFQRIRLATQIGSRLVGVLYVLDEPSIGLHPRDNRKLIDTFFRLRDLGNSVLVVEHDREAILAADHLIDLGPGAGEEGGYLVAQGTPDEVQQCEGSITGAYLSGRRSVPPPPESRVRTGELALRGASGNNLKSVDFTLPLGIFVCVTGVSGSGKSSLVNSTLYPALAKQLHRATADALPYDRIDGLREIDKVIRIDQSPIGRSPKSNPATYTGLFTAIRDLYTRLPEAKMRGYASGRFSFNVEGGRCEACRGEGVRRIEMHFLPDVYAKCETCGGRRYNRETLEIRFKGYSIADVLDMTVSRALEFFRDIPQAQRQLRTLNDVGLGYIRLGQPANALSGGEAQRIKLSSELSRTGTGKTLYILDEPTTGLHFEDIRVLIEVLDRLTDKGNTVLVIEHNLEVIGRADWIVDLGPEGGDGGGRIVAEGTPAQVSETSNSYTGKFLKEVLAR